ncbi:hypothetical protein JW711_04340 [Candidatus Woesearchaeota archaeon]|nr:hypothetical protein [Candidatus Woesearchaeota archaeon]
MRQYRVDERLGKKINKLKNKNRLAHEIVLKKIREICTSYDIEHYKNLRYELKDAKRVHIGHFVLIFSYDKEKDCIVFLDYDHHDRIYET